MDNNLPTGFISPKTKKMVVSWGVVLVVITFLPRIYSLIRKPQAELISEKDSEINGKITVLPQLREKSEKTSYKKSKYKVPKEKFDPNTYNVADWEALGLSLKQAEIVVKFSKRGLRSHSDLEKIYVFPKELLSILEDWTVYPQHEESRFSKQSSFDLKKGADAKLIDVNNASIEELIELQGIGEYLGNKIIEQREKLGGFVNIHQLKEIKYLDDEKFILFEKRLICNSSAIRQIKLNEATVDEFKSHPYISYSVANSLVKMRNQKGHFESIDEIKESVLINDELFQKIKPYLSL
ncbi:MAG: helix-hairpin-helix domain-containing protein [Bacteroidetes bacterium]|nr:helix-hairpin-helix domain-containing protein [Bacteroidota bacterium]